MDDGDDHGDSPEKKTESGRRPSPPETNLLVLKLRKGGMIQQKNDIWYVHNHPIHSLKLIDP